MSNVIPFDPTRKRPPRTMGRFQPGPYTELQPLWLDGDLKFNEVWPALSAAGFAIQLDSGAKGFVITRKECNHG